MWLIDYFFDSDEGVLAVRLSREKGERDVDGSVYVSSCDVRCHWSRGKSLIDGKLIEGFSLHDAGDGLRLFVDVMADKELNEMLKVRAPIRWRLGLIRPSKSYRSELFRVEGHEEAAELISLIGMIGYAVQDEKTSMQRTAPRKAE